MGRLKGFKEIDRKSFSYKDVEKRKKNFSEFIQHLDKDQMADQGARCMDCGTPFCHIGCPLGNLIPDFNHAVYQKDYKKAYRILKSTNNFPSFTGRICPAPCESACVLGINKPPVTIKSIELKIAMEAEKNGWNIEPHPPKKRTGKTVAIIGSGPAGLACAEQLNHAGHTVKVFERDDRIGGLLVYGIPNFKLDKKIVFAEVERLRKEGIQFETNVEIVGQPSQKQSPTPKENSSINHSPSKKSIKELQANFDCIVLAIGSTIPRDLEIKNRDANGICFAMDYLKASTKNLLATDDQEKIIEPIDVRGKDVVVLGGGDTGSDCIGTSVRKNAKSIIQLEILAIPPKKRDHTMPWPLYDFVFRVSSSQEEGCSRKFSIRTKQFVKDQNGNLTGLEVEKVKFDTKTKRFITVDDHSSTIKADIAILALGFVSPEKGLSKNLGIELDSRDNIKANETNYKTNRDSIFVCGDARRGQSLVVWALSEGRECAKNVDEYLTNQASELEAKNYSKVDNHLTNHSELHTTYSLPNRY